MLDIGFVAIGCHCVFPTTVVDIFCAVGAMFLALLQNQLEFTDIFRAPFIVPISLSLLQPASLIFH